MADKRINALATTASSTASDDFFAVDGTTNGTRKLNAFSPTFGGNATVTGTLTVNSTSPSVFAGRVRSNLSNTSLGDSQLHVQNAAASATNGALSQATFFGQPGYTTFVGTTGDGTTASYQGGVLGNAIRFNEGYVITDAANGLLLHGINGSIRFATGNPGSVKATFDSAGTLSLTATTASTTTSSGALVVSGGVGVGGAINAGSYLRSINSAAANDTEFTALRADVGADGTLGAATVAIGSLPSATGTSRYGFITCSDNVDWRKLYIGGRPGLAVSGGQVLIPCTTASTTTATGALVVSGGVGVAGNINSGGTLRFNTNANLPGVGSMGISATYGLNMYASTGSSYDFTVFNAAGTSLILNPTGTQNVTFPGVVAIGNTVTTGVAVASTHKVQISIGGTTYYLLASNV